MKRWLKQVQTCLVLPLSVMVWGKMQMRTSAQSTLAKPPNPSVLLSRATENYGRAAAYSQRQGGDALLILKNDEIVLEQYAKPYTAETPHVLASGTKSFVGILAIAAVDDKLLDLDEPAANTLNEWKADPQRSKITVRQLLNLTSGLAPGSLGQVPTYAQAVKSALVYPPGTRFQYGPASFQIFGEIMRRKLAARKESPLAYLKRQVLDPIGLKVGKWALGSDGNPNLASGASLTAREWAKFGQLLEHRGRWDGERVLKKKWLKETVEGSAINAAYGLGFWLNALGPSPINKPQNFLSAAPEDAFMAAGASDQRLYVIPSEDLVIVRFGRDNSFEDNTFLTLLFSS